MTRKGPDQDVLPTRVVVVGGGAAGVIAAAHLMRSADAEHRLEVHAVEKAPVVGPGLAYRTTDPRHTVNNYAARLSAIDGELTTCSAGAPTAVRRSGRWASCTDTSTASTSTSATCSATSVCRPGVP